MVDKWSIGFAAISMAGYAIGLGTRVLAQAGAAVTSGTELPIIGQVANITATGALVVFLLYTVPKWQTEAREERAACEASRMKREEQHAAERATWATALAGAIRDELRDMRDAFECKGGK